MRWCRWFMLVGLIAVSSCAPFTPTTADRPTDSLLAALDGTSATLQQTSGVPGMAVGIIRGGEVVWSQGYGVADRERTTPITPDTIFQAASISKSVTAWGVMTLVEEGKLDLDRPIAPYLTRWHLPPSPFDASGVTVRRLLSHTAGISLGGYSGVAPEDPLPTLEESLSGATTSGPVELIHPPGTKWQYSGGGYTILQLLIEEVSGEPFAAYMQHAVLDPLGMHDSSFAWRPVMAADVATPYDWDGAALPRFQFRELAAAGLYTTVADLARFGAASAAGPHGTPIGRGVLKPETVALMLEPQPASLHYGLGYQLDPGSPLIAMHAGSNRGWRTFMISVPRSGDGLIVLTNSDRGGALYEALTCVWSMSQSVGIRLERCHQQRYVRMAIVSVSAGGSAASMVYSGWTVRGLRTGRRQLVGRRSWRRWLAGGLVVLTIAMWWIWWYSDHMQQVLGLRARSMSTPLLFAPTAFWWVSWAVTVIGVGFLLHVWTLPISASPTEHDSSVGRSGLD